MKTVKHTAESRGFADKGWLQSYHSFSFSSYYNPERMNFGALRVLNDDVVQPTKGFGTHPHQNMEIISIPLKGALSHKDSMNNKRAIDVGEVQVMSAGTGLTHSEFNDSPTDDVNFLQLWIIPEEQNVTPNYEQKLFDTKERENAFQTVVSPQDKLVEGALGIHQQAYIRLGNFEENTEVTHALESGKGSYLFLIEGEVEVNGERLSKRDALGVWDTQELQIKAVKDSEVLVIDVPMN
jgi:redox-sensitive bicupin YhaK (pirin superfamily)